VGGSGPGRLILGKGKPPFRPQGVNLSVPPASSWNDCPGSRMSMPGARVGVVKVEPLPNGWISPTFPFHPRTHLQHLQRPASSDPPIQPTPIPGRGPRGVGGSGPNRLIWGKGKLHFGPGRLTCQFQLTCRFHHRSTLIIGTIIRNFLVLILRRAMLVPRFELDALPPQFLKQT
jgi:hypothetical protein